MRLLTTFTLLAICLTAIGQTSPHFISRNLLRSSPAKDNRQKPLTFYPSTSAGLEDFGYRTFWSPVIYETVATEGVTIQNSLPKGGRYTDSTGNNLGYTIFVTRVINDAADPLSLTMYFPATPIELTNTFPTIGSATSSILPSSYLTLFLPPDTMTLDKLSLYCYGVTDLESFLHTSFNKGTMLQRTINPKEDYFFYVGVLWSQISPKKRGYGSATGGPARAGFVLKEQDLFYSIRGISPQLDSTLIPSGRIVFKK